MHAEPQSRSEHHFAADREWAAALQHALSEVRARKEALGLASTTVEITAVSKTGLEFEATLTFRAGRKYCCVEPLCQFAGFDATRWQAFRAALAEVSDRTPPPMTLTIRAVFERGALVCSPDQSRADPVEGFEYRTEPLREREAR